MKIQLINIKTAKLAKKKEFNWRVKGCWGTNIDSMTRMFFKNDEFSNKQLKDDENGFTRPSQSLLQKFLREEHKISVNIKHYPSGTYSYYILTHNGDATGWSEVINTIGNSFFTYEEALEDGLYQALERIKQ